MARSPTLATAALALSLALAGVAASAVPAGAARVRSAQAGSDPAAEAYGARALGLSPLRPTAWHCEQLRCATRAP